MPTRPDPYPGPKAVRDIADAPPCEAALREAISPCTPDEAAFASMLEAEAGTPRRAPAERLAALAAREPESAARDDAARKNDSASFWPGTGLRILDDRDEGAALYLDGHGRIASGLTLSDALELGDLVGNAQRVAAKIGRGNAGRLAVIDTLLQALRPTIGNIPLRLTTGGC